MGKSLVTLTLLAAALTAAPPSAPAGDDPFIIVPFHPSPGREDELKTHLLRLRDFVNAHAPA